MTIWKIRKCGEYPAVNPINSSKQTYSSWCYKMIFLATQPQLWLKQWPTRNTTQKCKISAYRSIYSSDKIMWQQDNTSFAWNSLIIDEMPLSDYQIWSAENLSFLASPFMFMLWHKEMKCLLQQNNLLVAEFSKFFLQVLLAPFM